VKLKNVHYGWVVVFAATFILVIFAISIYSRGIFLTSLTEWFNWNRGDISSAYSIGMIVSGFLALISGRLTDKFGPRILITFLGLLVGGGLLLMSMVSSIIHVYLIWILVIGVGGSCSFTPITSTLPKWFTKRRGLAIGITFAGLSLGGVIWPPVVERLIANVGWRSAYIVVGLIVLVIITALAQLMKQSPQKIGLKPYGEKKKLESTMRIPDQTGTGFSFTQAFKTAPYRLIGLVRFCSMFIFQLVSVHIFPYAVDIGLSEITAAIIISITSISNMVSRLLAGFIADRLGYRLTLFLSVVVLTLSLVVLVFAKELWHFYAFALLFGFAWGSSSVTQVTLVAEFFGSRSLGTIIGSLEFLLTTGGAIGISIAGIIFDATGSYVVPFSICIIQALLVMLFSFLLMRYKHTGVMY
jgi:MFS family permease